MKHGFVAPKRRLITGLSVLTVLSAALAWWLAIESKSKRSQVAFKQVPSGVASPRLSEATESHGVALAGYFLLFGSKYFVVDAERMGGSGVVRLSFKETVPDNSAEASVPIAPGTAPGIHTAMLDSQASFFPSAFASRGGNDFFVSGPPLVSDPQADGFGAGTVLERWSITAPLGGPYTIRTPSTVPIGTPAPLSSLSAQIPGGTYIPAEQRSPARLRKAMLGYFPFSAKSIEVDPEGRFVLLLSPAEAKLYRLDLVNYTGTPVVILDGAAQPNLDHAASIYACRFHDQLKRYVISCSNGQKIVLRDSENDGVFEAVEVLTDIAYAASPLYGDSSGIAESYHNYGIVGLFQ